MPGTSAAIEFAGEGLPVENIHHKGPFPNAGVSRHSCAAKRACISDHGWTLPRKPAQRSCANIRVKVSCKDPCPGESGDSRIVGQSADVCRCARLCGGRRAAGARLVLVHGEKGACMVVGPTGAVSSGWPKAQVAPGQSPADWGAAGKAADSPRRHQCCRHCQPPTVPGCAAVRCRYTTLAGIARACPACMAVRQYSRITGPRTCDMVSPLDH